MSGAKWVLLASAPDLDAIGECIARFYGGEAKTLSHCGVNDVWLLQGARGTLEGVRVIKGARGRYRFEMRS